MNLYRKIQLFFQFEIESYFGNYFINENKQNICVCFNVILNIFAGDFQDAVRDCQISAFRHTNTIIISNHSELILDPQGNCINFTVFFHLSFSTLITKFSLI